MPATASPPIDSLPAAARGAAPLLLFDGECGLCDRAVQTILRDDPGGRLRFAPLQGSTAAPLLARHRIAPRSPRPGEPARFDSMVWVDDPLGPRERVSLRADAALAAGRYLGGRWASLARFVGLVPRRLRDAGYAFVARHRHRLFPPPDACRVPAAGERARFLP